MSVLALRPGLSCLAIAASLFAFTSKGFTEDCPGNPDALGTSRTIVVDPSEHPRVGTMQYDETLPLRDHEVVLTFDDGPLPPHSGPVLDILASQCVKATFFMIGRMANEYPEGVRRVRDAGHSVGTHSQSHPLTFERMPIERAIREIDDGIASITAALGDDKDVAPFFRIPGLLRSAQVEDYLASRHIMLWSADFPADDWRHVSPGRVISLALSRLEAKGKGILLLHDIQARTVAALPAILRELKNRNFQIVHVVPATAERPKTPTEPGEWRLHPVETPVAAIKWPGAPQFAFAATDRMDVPDLSGVGAIDHLGNVIEVAASGSLQPGPKSRIPLPQEPPWPRQVSISVGALTAQLPAPAEQLFRIGRAPIDAAPVASPSHRAAIEALPSDYFGADREAMNELGRASLATP